MRAAKQLTELLALRSPPVAVKFQDSPPEGLPRIESSAPSGCTYWKFAAEGRTFYTEAEDHHNCPIGAHTHGVDLPEETAKELEGLVGAMVDLSYIDMSEVPEIPHRRAAFGVVVYGPAAEAGFDPDAVLVCGNARQMMLLGEAVHATGVNCQSSFAGRPTCAAIPLVMDSGGAASNLGCIGNRVYTQLPDDELYFVISPSHLESVAAKLEKIVHANRELEKFHAARV